MTVTATVRRAGPFLGNGAATSFPFLFKVFAPTDLAVVLTNSAGGVTPLVLGSDYSVTPNPDQDAAPGGAITYPLTGAPMPVGFSLSAVGTLPYDQPLDFPPGGNFSAIALENQLDRSAIQVQQVAEKQERALTVPVGESGVELPPSGTRALRVLGFDAIGVPVAVVPTDGSAAALALSLASSANASQGAGQVGYSRQAYAAGTLGARVAKFILFSDYAPAANGVSDDSAKLVQAAADAIAAGLPLHLDGTKSYAISAATIAFAAGLNLRTNGAAIVNAVTNTSNTVWLDFGAGTTIDSLRIELPAGVQRDRVVRFQGANISIGNISVTSADQQNNADSNDHAIRFFGCANLQVGRITVSRYDRALIVEACDRVNIRGVDIREYVRAVWINDSSNVYIGASAVYIASPNAGTLPGHNGVLISSQTANVTKNITIEDFDVLNAGEHGIRVGGEGITNVNIVRPHIKGHGGCGIKCLGTDVGIPTFFNETIVIDSPVIEDGGTSAPAAKNRVGILVLYALDVQIKTPIIRKKSATWAGSYGILVSGCTDVIVTSPRVSACEIDGILIDAAFDSCTRVQVHGGSSNANGGVGLRLSAETNVLRRLAIDGLVLDGNLNLGFACQTVTGGTFVDSYVRARTVVNTNGAGACNSATVTLDVSGAVGATPLSGISCLNGSRWSDAVTLNIRKAGAWTAL